MMRRMDFQNAVDTFKHRVPFKPFVVEMEDGKSLIVYRPDQIKCFNGSATYIYPDGNDWELFVDFENVDRVVELPEKPVETNPAAGA
jgi:hypothetical protein